MLRRCSPSSAIRWCCSEIGSPSVGFSLFMPCLARKRSTTDANYKASMDGQVLIPLFLAREGDCMFFFSACIHAQVSVYLSVSVCWCACNVIVIGVETELRQPISNSGEFCFTHFKLMPLEMVWTHIHSSVGRIAEQTELSFLGCKPV